jgi:uncharacterized integral membrane protein
MAVSPTVWPLVAVFAAGVLVGMILAFLVAVIYTIEDPRMMARLHQRQAQPGVDAVEDDR